MCVNVCVYVLSHTTSPRSTAVDDRLNRLGTSIAYKNKATQKLLQLPMANANGMTQGVDSSMPATTALPPQNCTTTDAMDDKEDVDEEVVVIGYLNNWINAYAFVSSEYLCDTPKNAKL